MAKAKELPKSKASNTANTEEQKPLEYPYKPHYCSFCRRQADEVRRLIAGPNGIFICNECVEVCIKIFLDDGVGDYKIEFYRFLTKIIKETKISKTVKSDKKKAGKNHA
jgi:hypothetical protein